VRQPGDILRAVRLRQNDAGQTRRNHSGEVVERQTCIKRVDADPEAPASRRLVHDKTGDNRARFRLARGRYRIFEIEDQAVGAAVARLRELALAVAGNKQKRPQPHDGFLNINATRRQTQIASPRWL
jgi:hypothetical protein